MKVRRRVLRRAPAAAASATTPAAALPPTPARATGRVRTERRRRRGHVRPLPDPAAAGRRHAAAAVPLRGRLARRHVGAAAAPPEPTRCGSCRASPTGSSCSARCCGRSSNCTGRVTSPAGPASAPRTTACGATSSAPTGWHSRALSLGLLDCRRPVLLLRRTRFPPRPTSTTSSRGHAGRTTPSRTSCSPTGATTPSATTSSPPSTSTVVPTAGRACGRAHRDRRPRPLDLGADRSRGLVRSTYGHIAAGTPLWVRDDQFVQAAGSALR